MKKIYCLLFMLVFAFDLQAQTLPDQHPQRGLAPIEGRPFGGRGGREANRERIELFKVKFITEKLALTKSEAELFWPVYESHKKAVHEIMDNKTSDEIQLQEAMLNAKKKYKNELKPVLKTDERINEALRIDREFLNKVRFEMMRRKGFPS